MPPRWTRSRRGLRTRRSIADPRIENGVADVDQQVDNDIDHREHQDDGLYGREVTAEHGLDGETTEARQAEHAFGHHGAADQDGDDETDYGHNGDGSIAQRMAHQHDAVGEAFGARGADIVLVQHLQHRGTSEARDQRDEADRQGKRWQHHAFQELPEIDTDADIALNRQPAEFDGEDVDQAVTDDEARHREAHDREGHHQAV